MPPLKTEKSRRTLALPQVCVDALRTYRTRQLEQRLKAGGDWVDDGLDADQRCASATKSALLFGFLEPATRLELVTC